MRRKSTTGVRVLIVDDHPAVRDALASRIRQENEFEVCGEAADISEALHLIATTQPDVAVVDISLKTGDGIDLIKRIKDRNDHIRILVWSMHDEQIYAERALRAGALGYMTKDQPTDKMVEAIRGVLQGDVWLSPMMVQRLMHRSVGGVQEKPPDSPLNILADRELEVFRLIGQGVKTVEIAGRLHLSVKTIETYRHRIRQKLGLKDGTMLVHFATKWVLENE